MDTSPQISIRRSMLGRARGLGAARSGSAHWWAQRLTAIALVPLSLWFIASVISLEGATRLDVVLWLHSPISLVLMLCLIVASFWHLALGVAVVIEDYVHQEATRLALLLALRGAAVVLALLGIVSALRLGL
ncbi:MAG: succinate dehydrogenase, hydrophobic membrane anchor protein [Rhodospirillales bacterium]|nr:succinate dehydrogenase, hydrophobic membrane anchor protein [Rhodospirillales bacterium]